MEPPHLTDSDVMALIPRVSAVGHPIYGGQKSVYPITIAGSRYALKVFLVKEVPEGGDQGDYSSVAVDEAVARAQREVATLKDCAIPQLVKIGPIPLTRGKAKEQNIVYYTEEWVDGKDVRALIAEKGRLSVPQVVQLGLDVTEAVRTLWSRSKIHRDIKPANILQRSSDGSFVLLDLGLALDIKDISLTDPGLIPGTLPYFSPEQTDPMKKRQMDFRSDLFSLGVVMYEAVTGTHPFFKKGMDPGETLSNIVFSPAEKPSSRLEGIPPELDTVIMRLLGKRPHLRYRSCEALIEALNCVPLAKGV